MPLFIREPNVDLSGFSAENRIRRNAYVKVTGTNGGNTVRLPIKSDKNFSTVAGESSLYKTNNRPDPVLQGVTVTLEGTAGSLKRAEGKFICFTTEQFDKYEAALLRPGSNVTIKYGYVNSEASDSGTFKGKVYSFDFKYTEQNYIECTFKAVGQGNAISKTSASSVPINISYLKEFVSEYQWSNTKRPVKTLIDYFHWEIQNATGRLNSNQFRPNRGGYVDKNYFVCLAPQNFQPLNPNILESGAFADYRLIYVRLGHIIDKLNEFSELDSEQYIKFDSTVSYPAENMQVFSKGAGSLSLISCDPLRTIWNAKSTGIQYGSLESGTVRTTDAVGDILTLTVLPNEIRTLQDGPQNIYIALDELRFIEKKYLGDEPIHPSDNPSQKQNASLNVEEFLQDIFQVIKKASVGIIDLTLISNPDGQNAEDMFITDRSAIPTEEISPKLFDPAAGDGITRRLLLSGKVPKSVAADAFTKASNPSDPLASAGTQEITGESRDPGQIVNLTREYNEALSIMFENGCGPEGVSALTELFRRVLQEQVSSGLITTTTSPKYPLELDLLLNGVEGFKFGDLISSKLLPNIYRNDLGESKIGFTVTRITHTIESNDWTTSLTATCRLIKTDKISKPRVSSGQISSPESENVQLQALIESGTGTIPASEPPQPRRLTGSEADALAEWTENN